MKAKLLIPAGWRRVRTGGLVAKGDRILDREYLEWATTFERGYKTDDDLAIGENIWCSDFVIRRAKKGTP